MRRRLNFRLLPLIFALAWPTMLEQLMQTAVQYIDTAMVGSLGTDATAAVGSTTTVNWLVGSSVSALGVGFLAFISQALGAGKRELAVKASSQSVSAVLISGLFFTAFTLAVSPFVPALMQVDESIRELSSQYFFILYTPMLFRAATIIFGSVLRSAGDSKTPMLVGLAVNAINVVLNFLLIYPTRAASLFGKDITLYGADLGVIGAATASAVAFTAGGILITLALFRHKAIAPEKAFLKPDREILKPCLRVALPNMLQRFGTSFGYVVFASMINSLGEISTAAHTVANTVESTFYVPGYGMQAAAATLMGNAHGAKDSEKSKDISRLLIFIEVSLMIISGGLLFIFAEKMAAVFSDSPEVISLCATVLRMVALSEPFYGVSLIIEGMLQGIGNTKTPFIINIAGMWGIRIVGTFICIKLLSMGLISAWACMIGHNLMLFAAFTVYYRQKVNK
ncbi:MAG: MATE family efflux transporter [Clostridia bacterium]|nr:MATE family efflux transporter [Clostridia bacterium]